MPGAIILERRLQTSAAPLSPAGFRLATVLGLLAGHIPVGTLAFGAYARRATEIPWAPFVPTAQTPVSLDAHQFSHQD